MLLCSLKSGSEPSAFLGVVPGWHSAAHLSDADGVTSHARFLSEVRAASVVTANLLTVDMASTFPSCGVCGRSALVVFPLFVFTVGLHIKNFHLDDWPHQCYDSVLVVLFLLCFICSDLFVSLINSLCYNIQLPPLCQFFRVQLLTGPIHIVWLPCISTFTGNHSPGVPKQNAVRGKHHFLSARLYGCQ